MKKIAFTLALASVLSGCCDGGGKNAAEQVRIVAHRGYWNCKEAGFAQNSIASLRCAQEAGFWGSECDVQLTSDDSVVVFHDRRIGDVLISAEPYGAISSHRLYNGEPVPMLRDYLRQVGKCSSTVLVLEIKEGENSDRDIHLTDLCISELKEYGLYDPARVTFISFSWPVCAYLAEKAPEFMTEYLKTDKTASELLEAGVKGVDASYTAFQKDSTLLPSYLEAGLRVNVWTVDDVNEIAGLAAQGVHEITTNIPDSAEMVLHPSR